MSTPLLCTTQDEVNAALARGPACVVLHEVDQWGDQIKGAK